MASRVVKGGRYLLIWVEAGHPEALNVALGLIADRGINVVSVCANAVDGTSAAILCDVGGVAQGEVRGLIDDVRRLSGGRVDAALVTAEEAL